MNEEEMSPPPHEVEIGGFVAGVFQASGRKLPEEYRRVPGKIFHRYRPRFTWKILGRVHRRETCPLLGTPCSEVSTVVRWSPLSGSYPPQDSWWCPVHGVTRMEIVQET